MCVNLINMERKKLLDNAMNNIRKRRLARGWSQSKLAEECAWENSAGRIGNYEKLRREPTLSDLDKMASALGTSLEEILFGESQTVSDKPRTNYIQSPLLRMDEIDAWLDGKLPSANRSIDMYLTGIDKKRKIFSVIVEGDAMESPNNIKKSICDGDIVTVDVFLKPKPHDIVIARIKEQAKIREYTKDGTEPFLKAYNPAYASIKLDKEIKIIGVVINKHVEFMAP